MKKFLLTLAFLAAVGLERPAQAGFIVGAAAFVSNATTSVPGNNINNTHFTVHFISLSGPGVNQFGNYIGTSSAFTNFLDVSTPASLSSFVFGNLSAGTFTVSTIVARNLIPNISRTVSFSGIFHPGPATFPGGSDTPAQLTITINQARRGVLSASATLASTAPGVPEPSSIVLLGTFGVPAVFGWVRYRRRSKVS